MTYETVKKPCPVPGCPGELIAVAARDDAGRVLEKYSTSPATCGGHGSAFAPFARVGRFVEQRK